ncbi:hypothetical protein FA95DRAFT_390922 [Auriscalpium vulgare]|uniref:Uncharacterized protein n=1 Tax=Auriscalpium vulgare TaxID=40419 RepID=A0ACB8S456_9AGAM|nr:hypothetical protein FA95DRAFT_390922 [Auriscalpium vulgare]
MPSLSHTSLIRVHRNHSPLVVAVTHVLQLDASDHPVLHLDAPLVHPVLLHVLNSPVLSFTGIVNGVPVLPGQVMHSAVLQHVLGCLAEVCLAHDSFPGPSDHRPAAQNASQLGLGHVSDPYVDPVTDLPSVSLAPSLACPSTLTSRVYSPLFSTRLLLPLRSVLDEIGETFICEHMDNRYPFIFGVARKNFEIESQFFPALAQSLQGIVKRSATPCFRRRGSRLLRDIHRKVSMYRSASDADLNSSRHLGSTQVSDESVLSTALGIIFRDGVHPSRSKARHLQLTNCFGTIMHPANRRICHHRLPL